MDTKLQIGQRIKNKRLRMNLRMDDVAKEAGITRSTLWSIENGKGNYGMDALLKLLTILEMSLSIEEQETETRLRASRANRVLDKKINKFIIMCVEQYASSVDADSGTVYRDLKQAGILDELKDDYEDMHGMSTYSINEYIGKRLSGGVA